MIALSSSLPAPPDGAIRFDLSAVRNDRRKSCTVRLPVVLGDTLDKLTDDTGLNRSRVVEAMIVQAGADFEPTREERTFATGDGPTLEEVPRNLAMNMYPLMVLDEIASRTGMNRSEALRAVISRSFATLHQVTR